MALPSIPLFTSANPERSRRALHALDHRHALAVEDESGAFVVLHNRDVRKLLHDSRLKGLGLALFDLAGVHDGPLREWFGSIMFANEGQPHHRMRRLVGKAFTPQAVQSLRPFAAELVAERLANLRQAGAGDLIALLSDVPTRVMCRLLGVPEDDAPKFVAWLNALSATFLLMTPAQVAAATDAIVNLLDYVRGLRETRMRSPGEDLISALIAAEDDGDRLTPEETAQMVANLLVGGHDTTGAQIGCSLITLLQRPEVFAEIRADPAILPLVVDETIRFEPSIAMAPRTAVSPIELDGTEIPVGSVVFLCTMTANRDPEVWTDGNGFVSRRFADPATPKLMTFGGGAHFCLGTWLARMTLEEVLRGVAELEPELTVDPATIDWAAPLGAHPVRLPVAA